MNWGPIWMNQVKTNPPLSNVHSLILGNGPVRKNGVYCLTYIYLYENI
jgi:hypothetical protein